MRGLIVGLAMIVLVATCQAYYDSNEFEDIFDWGDRRQVNGKATVCLERNDKCTLGGTWSCCKGLSCQTYGISNQRRCEISSSQVCVAAGQTCSKVPGSRKCCGFNSCKSVLGRNICT